MDHHTLSNWFKVRQALESAGKTDSEMYKRALEVTQGKINPTTSPLGHRPRV